MSTQNRRVADFPFFANIYRSLYGDLYEKYSGEGMLSYYESWAAKENALRESREQFNEVMEKVLNEERLLAEQQ